MPSASITSQFSIWIAQHTKRQKKYEMSRLSILVLQVKNVGDSVHSQKSLLYTAPIIFRVGISAQSLGSLG